MAGGAKLLGEGVAKRGNGVGAWRVGEGGWDKGGGARGERGVESILKWSFQQNRYRYFRLGCRNSRYDTKSYTKSGNPRFLGESSVMTSRSRKYVIISRQKVRKWEGERFHLIIYARRSSHVENLWVLTSNFQTEIFH